MKYLKLNANESVKSENFKRMQQLREQNRLSDVTLKAGSESFPVHRIVVAAAIPYFYGMFTNETIEKRSTEVDLQEIDHISLKCILNFAYGQEVHIDQENVQNLFMASSFFLMTEMRNACVDFLVSNIEYENVIEVMQFAMFIDCPKLQTEADDFIIKNFQKVSVTELFPSLELKKLIFFISNDSLNDESEEFVFEACVYWVKHNKKDRLALFSELLPHIRLPVLSLDYFEMRVSQEPLMTSSVQCLKLLGEAHSFHFVAGYRDQIKSFGLNPRKPVGQVLSIGGYSSFYEMTASVEVYDPSSSKWKYGKPLTNAKACFSVAVLENKVYVFGGCTYEEDFLASVEVFYPDRNKWLIGPSMLTKRKDFGVAVLNKKAYACGGESDYGELNDVESFCPKTNAWSYEAKMIKKRIGCCVLSLNGLLYVLGGWYAYEYPEADLASAERYDPVIKTWEEITPMLRARQLFGAAVLNGKIFVSGGRHKNEVLRSAEVFDPREDIWISIAPMSYARRSHSLISVQGKLWAVGGCDGDSYHSSVEEYDPEKDQWTHVDSMNSSRAFFGFGMLP